MKIDVKAERLRSEEKTRFETLKQADSKSEVKEKSWKSQLSEDKVMRIETQTQADLRSEVKKRWWSTLGPASEGSQEEQWKGTVSTTRWEPKPCIRGCLIGFRSRAAPRLSYGRREC